MRLRNQAPGFLTRIPKAVALILALMALDQCGVEKASKTSISNAVSTKRFSRKPTSLQPTQCSLALMMLLLTILVRSIDGVRFSKKSWGMYASSIAAVLAMIATGTAATAAPTAAPTPIICPAGYFQPTAAEFASCIACR